MIMVVPACVFADSGSGESYSAKEDLVSFGRKDTSFYSTFWKKQLYEPSLGLLDPINFFRTVTFTKPPALDVNIYDEVLDNNFFTNRQGKKRLSLEKLVSAPLNQPDSGPSQNGPWIILKGKSDGVTPGFFIKDANGDKFLLKFDPRSNPEMTTSSEVITHKLFYAFGYNVPSYVLVKFHPDILEVASDATYYNDEGFEQPLTKDKALEMLKMHVPIFKGGMYRASASRILKGPLLGYFDYDQRKAGELDDLIPHDQLRALRALRVFGSWTNNYDLHRKNTMDVLVEEEGKQKIKHYLLDFGSSLGSSGYRAKVPAVGFENLIDYKAILRAIGLLKVKQKPWEIRWDDDQHTIRYPSIGYFDNDQFDPGHWKSNLPHTTFGYLTDADAYWAAKIISKFTDEDIEAVVKTGKLSSKTAEDYLINTLIERRDMVVQYWFDKVTPLENFYITASNGGVQISFDDLMVQKGWAPNRTYEYKLYALEENKKKPIAEGSSETSVIILPPINTEEAQLEISAITNNKKSRPLQLIFKVKPSFHVISIEH